MRHIPLTVIEQQIDRHSSGAEFPLAAETIRRIAADVERMASVRRIDKPIGMFVNRVRDAAERAGRARPESEQRRIDLIMVETFRLASLQSLGPREIARILEQARIHGFQGISSTLIDELKGMGESWRAEVV